MRRLFLLLSVFLTVCAIAQPVTVGSKKFTESIVLGEIVRGMLAKGGFEVDHKEGMGATIIVWEALKQGSVDIYPEYTGTIAEEILKTDRALTPDEMREELKKHGIGMSEELGFNNTYALVMKRQRAEELGISKISDLRDHPELPAGPTIEFLGRADGWKPLMAKYGVALNTVKGIEHTLGYQALESGDIAIKDAYSTDAVIAQRDLVVLEDDLGFFPQYKAVFLYRLDLPTKVPEILNSMAETINEDTMVKLNARAEEEGQQDYVAAANLYLDEQGIGASFEKENIWHELFGQTLQHLYLVGVSLGLAILIGVPLGVRASKPGAFSSAILGLTGLFQTIPSLALFAILVPWMGTQPRTAILALFLYSLLPIVRNTATGLSSISPSLKEAGAALGLGKRARLLKIELPLASPTILAGIKVSAIINVGTATIAAFIGAGGLGQSIQTGLALSDHDLILRGGIAAAFLALVVQLAFDLLDRVVIPRGLRLPALQ